MMIEDFSNIIIQCQQLRAQGKSDEDIIDFLRIKGYSKAKTVLIFARGLQLNFEQAVEVVHRSKTWEDVRESDDRLTDAFLNASEQDEADEDKKGRQAR